MTKLYKINKIDLWNRGFEMGKNNFKIYTQPEILKQLRERCEKTPFVPKDLNDHYLDVFMAAGDNKIDSAYENVLEYFSQKKESRHLFENRDPMSQDIQEAWKFLKVCFLPKTTPEGFRILLCGLWDSDPSKINILACIRMFLMAVDVGLFLEDVYPGYILLLDTEGLSIKHFPWGSLADYNRFIRFLQSGMPVYVRQIHILRNSKMIEKVYTCIKPFLKKELKEIMHFHTGEEFKEFHKKVPQDCLPKDLGGTIPSVLPYQEVLKARVEEHIVELSKDLEPIITPSRSGSRLKLF